MYVTFSGANKTMIVTAGGSEINVERDLYSGWKHWVSESDNAKFLQAFRTFGGDPTSSGQYAPKYFFLLNGWKVYVDGLVTPNVDVALNLYVDGGGDPFIKVNSATVSNLRSDVAVVESELQNTLDYDGIIVYDAIDGQSGSTHPTGTLAYPVNNSADLQTLMDLFDINRVLLQSNMVVTQDFNNIYFETNTAAEFLNPSGNKMDECFFYRLNVMGDFGSGGTGSQIVTQDCAIGDVQGIYGVASNCHLAGTIILQANQQFVMSDVASAIPGTGTPVIDMNAGVPTGLSMRRYSGGLRIINCDHADDVATLEYVAGKCHIGVDSGDTGNNIDGYISVRGIALVNDWTNGTGTTVDTSALFETSNEYQGKVSYDINDGSAGTSYPVGTDKVPVNNIPDMVALMTKYNIHEISVESDITLDPAYPLPNVKFHPHAGIVYLNVNGCDIDGALIDSVGIYGDFNHSQVILRECVTGPLYNIHGMLKECSLEGNISASPNGELTFMNTIAGNAQQPIELDIGIATSTTVNMRGMKGGVIIKNMNNVNDVVVISLDGGKAIFDSTNTAGEAHVGGVGQLIDNSDGATILSLGLWNTTQESARIQEILGLNQSNFIMSGQTYNVNNDLLSAVISTYPTSTDVDNDTNKIASYTVSATYAGDLLSSYKVVKD